MKQGDFQVKSFNLVCLICAIFIIGITFVQAADFQFMSGLKPNGFRDIKWGSTASSVSDMNHVENRVVFGETLEVYRRDSDAKMKMGNVELYAIYYIFWKGKLHSVEINVNGKEDFMLFRKELIEKYGGDNQNRPIAEMYFWLGDGPNDPVGILNYVNIEERGTFFLDTGEFYTKFKAVSVE